MPHIFNHLGQPIGLALPEWKSAGLPSKNLIEGKSCNLEILNPKKHALELFQATLLDKDEKNWTYLPYGPFNSFDDYEGWLQNVSAESDPFFYTIIDKATQKAVGLASYLNIKAKAGSIEIGHLYFSPLMQKKTTATESMYLMMKYAFELGYRRYEWKCDQLNAPSREAAIRFGFKFEGTFRQAVVYKGRTRNTDYFSIIDSEWPLLKISFESWLDDTNFDQNKNQIRKLQDFIK